MYGLYNSTDISVYYLSYTALLGIFFSMTCQLPTPIFEFLYLTPLMFTHIWIMNPVLFLTPLISNYIWIMTFSYFSNPWCLHIFGLWLMMFIYDVFTSYSYDLLACPLMFTYIWFITLSYFLNLWYLHIFGLRLMMFIYDSFTSHPYDLIACLSLSNWLPSLCEQEMKRCSYQAGPPYF